MWDEQLICDLLNPLDASRVLQIPINNQGFDDFISWHFTNHGRYMVRQWKHQLGPRVAQLSAPGESGLNPVWKLLWKLKNPNKVKIFIWRALHGIVPLKSIIVNRHIGSSGECSVFQLGPEESFVCFSSIHRRLNCGMIWAYISISRKQLIWNDQGLWSE
jgi:hypothetical protein